MEWNQGDLVWFDPGGLGHPLPGEIQEVHRAAQVIVVQAVINGKVNINLNQQPNQSSRWKFSIKQLMSAICKTSAVASENFKTIYNVFRFWPVFRLIYVDRGCVPHLTFHILQTSRHYYIPSSQSDLYLMCI